MNKAVFLFIFILTAMCLSAQSPEWMWAKQAGGMDYDSGYGIATDSIGNSYVTGCFEGTATFGNITLTTNVSYDIFIAKLDSNGSYLWAKQAGGTSSDDGLGIATDSNGNCYVTGFFSDNATFGTTTLTSNGYNDIFIIKLDSNGNYLWAKQAGGAYDDQGRNISIDNCGNTYVTGVYQGYATFDNSTITGNGSVDIFVTKLDTDGNYLWVKQAGGASYDYCYGIATDSSCDSYVTGIFENTATFGISTITSNGYFDIFIAKLDTNGNWLWAKQAGGISFDRGRSIATDSSGNSYVTGFFPGSATFGTISLISSGIYDIFVAKLDTNGNWLWVKQAGGTDAVLGWGIAADWSGNSYVTGSFQNTAVFGSTTLTSNGYNDIFIAKLDTHGNWLWTMQAGGSFSYEGYGIAADCNGNIYVTGVFYDNATFGNTSISSNGEFDIFIAKLSCSTSVSDEYGVPQANFTLGQNYPNPFITSTSFAIEVSDTKAAYEVSVYNLRGRHICTLHRGVIPAGKQTFTWNGKDAAENELSNGVYFYRVSNGITSQVKKMIYVK